MSTDKDELDPKDFINSILNDDESPELPNDIIEEDETNNNIDVEIDDVGINDNEIIEIEIDESTEVIPFDEDSGGEIIMSEHKRKTIENVSEHSLEDYEYVRSNIYDTIEASQSILETALNIAKETEAPQAIKSATDAVKTLVDVQKELIALQKEAMALSRDYEDMIFDEAEYNSKNSIPKASPHTNNHQTENVGSESSNPNDSINVSMTTTQLLEMLEAKDSQSDVIDVTPEPKP